MRVSLFFIISFLTHEFSYANSRVLTCDAADNFDRTSEVEFDVDSGDLKVKETGTSVWRDFYSSKHSCGIKITDPQQCVKTIWHNFDDLNSKTKSATMSVRCKVGDTVLVDQNGDLEINTFGDKIGYFICGRLSKNELSLTNCK